MLQIQWAIPEKKGEELLRTYFSENPLEFFIYLLPWKFQTNQFSTPGGNCAKRCYICRKFQDQKPRPLEIQHNSFLVTPENSTLYYFDDPGNSISSTPPPLCLLFFWNSPMQKESVFFFHLILVGILSILILSVKNRQNMHKFVEIVPE